MIVVVYMSGVFGLTPRSGTESTPTPSMEASSLFVGTRPRPAFALASCALSFPGGAEQDLRTDDSRPATDSPRARKPFFAVDAWASAATKAAPADGTS